MKALWSVKPMVRRKHECMRFCAQVDRCCARMNSGLAAVALVLAATTLFVTVLQAVDKITRDPQWSKLPPIETSPDSPDTSLWTMGD
jgi:hypothetical protein